MHKKLKNNRLYRRRLQDVRIWKQIRERGFDVAAVRLSLGYSFWCHGLGMRISSWAEKVYNSYKQEGGDLPEGRLEYLSRCRKDYLRWVDECVRCGVNHHAAMDILFCGKNNRDVEKYYHRRHGWGIDNLMQALELYRK